MVSTVKPQGFNPRAGFTLIELLVVIAIVAVLSVVVILTLNPAELLKHARDSTRISDMASLNRALNIFQTDVTGGSLGTASTTYVSIADPSATSTAGDQCQGLGLPTLPSGWTYHCAATSTLRNTDGTGWIPVNFKNISSGSPLGSLPVDPTNVTSSGQYYTFAPGASGGWEQTAVFESQKYQPQTTDDGGVSPSVYEIGSNHNISPFVRNLFTDVGDFEGSDNGFGNYSGGTFVSTASYGSVTGESAESVQAAASPGFGSYGGMYNNSFPTLIVGKKYTLSFYLKSISNTGDIAVSIQSGGGDQNCLTFGLTPTTNWQLYSQTCVLDFAKPVLYIYSTAASQQFAIDALQVVATP